MLELLIGVGPIALGLILLTWVLCGLVNKDVID